MGWAGLHWFESDDVQSTSIFSTDNLISREQVRQLASCLQILIGQRHQPLQQPIDGILTGHQRIEGLSERVIVRLLILFVDFLEERAGFHLTVPVYLLGAGGQRPRVDKVFARVQHRLYCKYIAEVRFD